MRRRSCAPTSSVIFRSSREGHVQGMLSLRDTLATRLAEAEEEKNVLRDVVLAARGR